MNIKMMETAVDRNIVVYDSAAKDVFTARLFALMSVIGRRNSESKKAKIVNIFISSEDDVKVSEELAINEDILFRYNVKFIDYNLTEHYKHLGGSLMPDKKGVLLATYDDGSVLLGMF